MVGVGLLLLSSLCVLVVGGDCIYCVEGVLLGLLVWLFYYYDG